MAADPLRNFAIVAPPYMAMLIADSNGAWGLLDAAAVFGNAGYESKGLTDDQEDKPVVAGSRGGRNWMQWTGSRRVAFERYCLRNNLDPDSDIAAYKWLILELGFVQGQGGEEKAAVRAVAAAGSLEAKVIAFEKTFLRAGVKNYPGRLAWAQRALDAYHVWQTTKAEPPAEKPVEDPVAPVEEPKSSGSNVVDWIKNIVTRTTLQYILNAIGGVIIAKGWIDGDTWTQISGALLVLIPALVGIAESAKSKVSLSGHSVSLAKLPASTQIDIKKAVEKVKAQG